MVAMRDLDRLRMAAKLAARRDGRSYLVGAVGERHDGVVVASRNGFSRMPVPASHAEARLCLKLDVGATVWVARVTRDGHFALAKPCAPCEERLRSRGVRRVVYTTGPGEYEVLRLLVGLAVRGAVRLVSCCIGSFVGSMRASTTHSCWP